MADLIQEYFQRDLTQAEHEALSRLLQESPEAALKYAGLLEQNYLATGLPQPSLPPGLHSLRQAGGGGLGKAGLLKLLLVGLGAAGVALWHFWPQIQREVPAPSRPSSLPQGSIQHRPDLLSHKAKRPSRPMPTAAGPGQEGQELSVVVNTAQKSLVTVHILDAQGKEVRALYTGFVEPGHWAFHWDGLLENGEPAHPGDYLIDVQSGETHLSKNIQIKLNSALP